MAKWGRFGCFKLYVFGCGGSLLFVALVGLVLTFFDRPLLIGTLTGDDRFLSVRQAPYWFDVLRKEGESGRVSGDTVRRLLYSRVDSHPFLLEAGAHADENVRFAALLLLKRSDRRTQPALDCLIARLDDEVPRVRYAAVEVLNQWGPMARPALPKLGGLCADADFQVCCMADQAVWRIDPAFARTAEGWKSFTPPPPAIFTIDFPGRPDRTEESQWSLFGPARMVAYSLTKPYGVFSVMEFEPAAAGGRAKRTPEARPDDGAFWKGFWPAVNPSSSEVKEQKPVTCNGLTGQEVLRRGAKGCRRARTYWLGTRMIVAQVLWLDPSPEPGASAHFLDSLTFNAEP